MSALPKLDIEPRLVVALATHGGRLQAHVRAFLSGPGGGKFVISDSARAQVLIADFDNDLSRIELHRFLLEGQGPAIVLAMTDPGIPGTVWVPKPVQDDALLAASQLVWSRLARPLSSPTPVVRHERPTLRLLPSPVPHHPSDGAARRRPPGRALLGQFRDTQRYDWTSRIVWVALGSLLIAAVVSSLGWRPQEQGFRPLTMKVATAPAVDPTEQDLRQAVEQAIRAMPPRSSAQQALVDAELAQYRRLSTVQADTASWARLSLSTVMEDVSRKALPVDLMADAGAPWRGPAEVRAALAGATRNASVVARRDD